MKTVRERMTINNRQSDEDRKHLRCRFFFGSVGATANKKWEHSFFFASQLDVLHRKNGTSRMINSASVFFSNPGVS